jgi:glutamyl-tRNA reductase
MSVLVVGLSHRSAPVTVLERAAVSGDALAKLLHDVAAAEPVAATFVVSTCNRVEVYADVDKFHPGVSAICELLARHSAMGAGELTPYLYVHYEDRAVQHLLCVACGLDSMVVGERQIVGQVRQALAFAREQGTLGRTLDGLGSLALRTARRVHAETGIDRAGASLVSVGIELAAGRLRGSGGGTAGGSSGTAAPGTPVGPGTPAGPGTAAASLHGLRVLVVGAGSMSSLAAATAARLGAARIVIANRTPERARRLAASVAGSCAGLRDLESEMARADLVISCTGAAGLVIGAGTVARALSRRGPAGSGPARPLVLLDLALPRDVDPAAAGLAGVSLLDLESLQDAGTALAARHAESVAAARAIVAEELAAQSSARHAARVAPTVVALRAKAAEVVEAELARLGSKLGDLDGRARTEIARAMHRVVDKLLHAPTVRVKELAGSPGGDSYETALRVLFDLDPATVEAVTRADPPSGAGPPSRAGAPAGTGGEEGW